MGSDIIFEVHDLNLWERYVTPVGQYHDNIWINKQIVAIEVVARKGSTEDLLDDRYYFGSVVN